MSLHPDSAEAILTTNANSELYANIFLVLSETGAVEAIASAVPNDNVAALKIRLFSTSVTSTCQAFASGIIKYLYNICV